MYKKHIKKKYVKKNKVDQVGHQLYWAQGSRIFLR